MTNEKRTNWIVNILGALVAFVVLIYIVRDATYVETTPPCHATFPPFTTLSLRNDDGDAVSSIELQAVAGSPQWGIGDKLSAEASDDAGRPTVLRFDVAAGDVTNRENPEGSAGFHWSPAGMDSASSVCLVYDVWVPKNFQYGGGGILPGVASNTDAGDDERSLKTMVTWTDRGQLNLNLRIEEPEEKPVRVAVKSDGKLKKGQWTRIHQEIDLGEPGKANGSVRIWIDDELKGSKKKLKLRDDRGPAVSNLAITASYGGFGSSGEPAPKETIIRLTPPEISWK